MRTVFEGLLVRYGQRVWVSRPDGEAVFTRAFVQPVLGRGQETPQGTPTPLGIAAERQYRYLGSPDIPLAEGDRVEALGRRFRVRAAEPVAVGEECSHWWALLTVDDEEDTCE